MEQKCNLFDEERISIMEATVVQSQKSKIISLASLTRFHVKGYNYQTPP